MKLSYFFILNVNKSDILFKFLRVYNVNEIITRVNTKNL